LAPCPVNFPYLPSLMSHSSKFPPFTSKIDSPCVIATLSEAKGKQSHSHYPELASGPCPSQRQPIFMIRWWAPAHDGLLCQCFKVSCGRLLNLTSPPTAPAVAFHRLHPPPVAPPSTPLTISSWVMLARRLLLTPPCDIALQQCCSCPGRHILFKTAR